jgi:NADH dehydrogenase [ubiquinone] 1 alpha subcomplex assembly factor 1
MRVALTTDVHKKPMHLFSFKNMEDCQNWLIGSDADIGGLTKAYWAHTPQKTGLFWGTLSTQVPNDSKLDESGYAAIRSKELPFTLFSKPRMNTSLYHFLKLRVKGDSKTWCVSSIFVYQL